MSSAGQRDCSAATWAAGKVAPWASGKRVAKWVAPRVASLDVESDLTMAARMAAAKGFSRARL